MKKVTRTYIYNWKSITLLIGIAILIILFGFTLTTNIPSEFGVLPLFFAVCLSICFYSKYYTKETSKD